MNLVAQENKILKKVIDELISIDIGIYPKSVQGGGKHDYEKRTLYMDGWNNALIEHMKKVCEVLDKNDVEVLDDEVLIERNTKC